MRRGQVALYLIAVMVGLFLIALLNVDAFDLVRGKNRAQNGGDAAAIAAASEQGRLLNEIGRLNVEHIMAAVGNDRRSCDDIVEQQRRIALIMPVWALRKASDAAVKNGMPIRDSFSKILREHVNTIRTQYCGGTDNRGEPYPEPYPGAWEEYASAIEEVISGGLACGADNIEFFGAMGGHYLLMRDFYNAVAAPDWCWFYYNAKNLLSDYQSYRDWAPLPSRDEVSHDNSEIFGLHVRAWTGAITDILSTNEIQHICTTYGSGKLTDEQLSDLGLLADRGQVWFLFDDSSGRWGRWFDGLKIAGDDSGRDFPLVGEVRKEYNVRGCAAVCRCITCVTSVALDAKSTLTWCAAAKPFGTVENARGETDVVTALGGFIVPCFSNVRLVALDAVGSSCLCTADYEWITHVRDHLPEPKYMIVGPDSCEGQCFYCQQLRKWERASFRSIGVQRLRMNDILNGKLCEYWQASGGGGSGGTSYGH